MNAIVEVIAARPASRVPWRWRDSPISLTSSSAVLLSLLASISWTTSLSGSDWIDASSVPSAGAWPTPAPPDTTTPRSASRRTNSRAAASLGSSDRNSSPSTRESFAISASYGPPSNPATPAPQPGAKNSSSYARAVAEHLPVDPRDPRRDQSIGERIERRRVEHGIALEVRRRVPVAGQHRVTAADHVDVAGHDAADGRRSDDAGRERERLAQHLEGDGGDDELLGARREHDCVAVGRSGVVAVDRERHARTVVDGAEQRLRGRAELLEVEVASKRGRRPPQRSERRVERWQRCRWRHDRRRRRRRGVGRVRLVARPAPQRPQQHGGDRGHHDDHCDGIDRRAATAAHDGRRSRYAA